MSEGEREREGERKREGERTENIDNRTSGYSSNFQKGEVFGWNFLPSLEIQLIFEGNILCGFKKFL